MHKITDFLKHNSNWFCLGAVLLFCAVSFLIPIYISGLPDGFDLSTDLRFASAFRDGILNGNFSPGWANDNFGFGSIGIRFYPPIAFYTLAFGEMITGDWFSAIFINLFGWMCLGCIGIYFFVKEWSSPGPAMVAGMIYAIVPQHLTEIYGYFLYAEFAAWGVMPFCFLFVTRICRGGKWLDVFLFATSYSVLILTHIPTTIMVTISLPVYVLVLLDWRRFKNIFLQLFVSIALTLAATSYRWIQIVSEFNWLAHNDPKWSTGKYGFSVWLFPNILETRKVYLLELMSWLTDITIILTILLLIPAFPYLFTSAKTKTDPVRKIIIATTITALFAFFMLSKPSLFIWNNAGFLQKIQFPWRWLSILSMLGVVSIALTIPLLVLRFQKIERLIVYFGLAVIVVMMLFDITQIIIPSEPIPRAKFGKIEIDLQTKPIFEGWWPIWAKEEAFETSERVMAGNRRVDVTRWESETREFTVQRGDAVALRVSTFYYPLWTATVNGDEAEIEMDEFGAIIIPIHSEVSTVHLNFEEPYSYRIAKWLSLATWLLFSLVIISCIRKMILTAQNRTSLLNVA